MRVKIQHCQMNLVFLLSNTIQYYLVNNLVRGKLLAIPWRSFISLQNHIEKTSSVTWHPCVKLLTTCIRGRKNSAAGLLNKLSWEALESRRLCRRILMHFKEIVINLNEHTYSHHWAELAPDVMSTSIESQPLCAQEYFSLRHLHSISDSCVISSFLMLILSGASDTEMYYRTRECHFFIIYSLQNFNTDKIDS